jgi:hypothetical protein
MKTQLRISAVSLFAVLILTMTAVPVSATLLFSNGPPAGNIYGWEIYSGYVVSNTVVFTSGGTATSFTVGLWVLPGQLPTGLDWSITATENGTPGVGGHYNFVGVGTDLQYWGLANGTIGGGGSTGVACPPQPLGCDLYEATVSIPGGVPLNAGIYWLNLQNATATAGPVGWDENDGLHRTPWAQSARKIPTFTAHATAPRLNPAA